MTKTCQQIGCDNPVMPGSVLCLGHTLAREGAKFAQRKKKRAEKANEAVQALLWNIASTVAENDQLITRVNNEFKSVLGAMRQKQQAQRQPHAAPAAPPKINPFDVLGLDPRTATVNDVRRVQGQLAKIYHPDVNNKKVMSGKMQQVNEAAAAAISYLEARK
jgi:hypothetical protein